VRLARRSDRARADYVERDALPAAGRRRFATPPVFCIEWNPENQLTRVTKNAIEQARFKYDPIGRRVEKVASGLTTTYAYDDADILRQSGATTLKYVHGPGVDESLASDDGSSLSYLHADLLGTVVKTTSASGAVTLTRQYDAWGNLQAGATTSGYAFTGREWDPEAGLDYNRARYYDPRSGRFIGEDPIGFAGGDVNLYRYAGGNPVNLRDPSGQFVGIPIIVWVTEVAAPYAVAGAAAVGAWGVAAWEYYNGVQPDPEGSTSGSRSIELPRKPNCGCTCTCRADADDTMQGNIKPGLPLFAFGTATASNCFEAAKDAKRLATRTLGMKPKHVGCRCAGK
jgi:RHS repeat-associated protein